MEWATLSNCVESPCLAHLAESPRQSFGTVRSIILHSDLAGWLEELKAECARSTAPDFALTTLTTIQDVPEGEFAKHGLTKEKLLQMLQKMFLLRRFEEKIEELFLVKGALIGPSISISVKKQ